MESVDVVKIAIPSFRDYRKGPPVTLHIGRAVLDLPRDDSVADHAHAVRVGDHDGTVEKSGVVDPGRAGHFAVAVEREPGRENSVVAGLSAGMNGGDAGAHRAFADFEFAFAGDQSRVTDLDTFHVGDGIVRAGSAIEGYA